MHGTTTKALLECIENGVLNTEKFFQLHPLNESLKQDLVELKKRGYIAIDYGDNTIIEIAANQKLLDLLKANHQFHTPQFYLPRRCCWGDSCSFPDNIPCSFLQSLSHG